MLFGRPQSKVVDCSKCVEQTSGFAPDPGVYSDPAIPLGLINRPSSLYPLATDIVCSGLRELSTMEKLNNAFAKIGGFLGLTFAVLLAIKKYQVTPLNCINSVDPYVATNLNIQMHTV